MDLKIAFFILINLLTRLSVLGQSKNELLLSDLEKVTNEQEAKDFFQANGVEGDIIVINENKDTIGSQKYFYDYDVGYIGILELENGEKLCVKILRRERKEFFRVSHIYISGGEMSQGKLDSIRSVIYSRLKKGESFGKLANEYSKNLGFGEGDLGWFSEGIMVKGFEDSVKEHKKGEIYNVDIADYNWHYIVQNTHDPTYFTEITFSAFYFPESADDEELFSVYPQWEIGDTRKVESKSITKLIVGDSLITDLEINSEYRIKVIDTTSYYTLLFSQTSKPMDIDVNFNMEAFNEAEKEIMKILSKVEREVSGFNYKVKVDKISAQAIDILNSEEFLEKLQFAIEKMITEFGKKQKKTKNEIAEMKKSIPSYINEMAPKLYKSMLNSVNAVFQPYTYNFPLNSSADFEILAHDINLMGKFGETEFPAILTVGSEEVDENTLVIRTNTAYDIPFFLNEIRKQQAGMANLKPADVTIVEREEIIIDLNTTWIKEQMSECSFDIGTVRSIQKTIVTFK